MNSFHIRVADVTICVRANSPKIQFDPEQIPPPDRSFLVSEGGADVHLQVDIGEFPVSEQWRRVFVGSNIWELYQSQGAFMLRLKNVPLYQSKGKQVAIVFRDDITEGKIFLPEVGPGAVPYPLAYPVHELIMVMHLAGRKGFELHACGVIDRTGRATLFSGRSGAGKSTLAGFMMGRKELVVLSDDRVIVRRIGKEWWAYGTPWHGDARTYANIQAPIEKIYLLEQADAVEVEKMGGSDAATLVLAYSFPTYWSQDSMDAILRSVEDLVAERAVFRLRFPRDPAVLEQTLDIKQ